MRMPLDQQTDILARMSGEDREALLSLGTMQRFSKGEFVFRAGAPGKHVYFLRKGRVKICQPSHTGKEVILWFCFAGEMFGLAEVAQGGGRVVHAHVCEASEVLKLSQSQFSGFLRDHPDSLHLVMQVLSCRMRTLSEVIVNLVNDDVETRIMKLILRLSARHGVHVGQDIHLDITLTHQEIADMVGTTRQTVTGMLSKLKRRGFLSLENRRIYIESPEMHAATSGPDHSE
jgi:CRP/FNR family transcriptional regulator, cyclic AMP receptor protein